MFYSIKRRINWHLIRVHLSTFAVAVSFSSTWRLPRDAFRYGGLISCLIYTLSMVGVSMPAVLLQLSIGQLSQQDVVGVWRAVPFFTGIGYLRLLTSFLYSICTIIYLSVCVTYFLLTLSNSLSYWACPETVETMDTNGSIYETEIYNTSSCFNITLLASVKEESEYYVAMSLIVIVLWILFPFVLYNPVKFMKKVFYAFGPLIFVIGVIIVACIGDSTALSFFYDHNDWNNIEISSLWHGCMTQALLSAQLATGFLISSGDTIYANTDVEWSTLAIVGVNVIMGWGGVIFWFAIGGYVEKDTSNLGVLVQTLYLTVEQKLAIAWPILIFAMLTLSGTISMVTLLYPLYDRIRRIGGNKWRYVTIAGSIVAAAVTLSALAVGQPVLVLIENVVVPLLATLSTGAEIAVFVFIYGWKILVEDVEFLTERKLSRLWVFAWHAVPAFITSLTIWWALSWYIIEQPNWDESPWEASGLVCAFCLSLGTILTFGVVAVARQVQYDVLTKIKSSFRPSRHWGPRDPITHYYWLTRREEFSQNIPRTRYRRRILGQFSGNSSFLNISQVSIENKEEIIEKKRANSDDLLFIQRKQLIAELYLESEKRPRSKSLDWAIDSNIKVEDIIKNKE